MNESKRFGGLRPGALDLAALLLITLCCLALRLPTLDRIALNPDESQYEATASYLLATEGSAFSLTYGVPATIGLYKSVGRWFGPYSMPPVRLLVLLVCLSMAWLLYAWVRAEGSRLGGLAAALVFVYLAIPFEGHSANREWFAGWFLLVGAWLCRLSLARTGRGGVGLLVLSGIAGGVALWFKFQAGYIVLAVPLFLAFRGLGARRPRVALREIASYAAGGVAATLVYLSLFFSQGALSGYLGFLGEFFRGYVSGNEAVVTPLAVAWSERYLLGLPGRGIFLISYLLAGWVVAAALVQAWRGPREGGRPSDSSGLLFALYLVSAMLAVQMGHRFFPHYYLLMLPPTAGLFGLALVRCGARGSAPGRPWFAGVVVGAVLLEVALQFADRPWSRLITLWPASFPELAYLLALGGLLFCGALQPSRRLREVAQGSLLLAVALLAIQIGRLPPPDSMPHHRRGYPELVRALDQVRQPGDRLFVWGWAPEIYSLTRMEAASHLSITQYVVGDYQGRPAAPRIDEAYAAMLLEDLQARSPRFIVDAAARSWTMAEDDDPRIYRLAGYPEFELLEMLDEEYRELGRFDECTLYERR